MLIGLSSQHFREMDVLDASRAAAEKGFQWVELWMAQLYPYRDREARFAEELRGTGMGWSVHADMRDLNLASRNEGIRRESLRQITDTIRFAAGIGAAFLTVHPGRAGSSKDVKADCLKIQTESLAALVETAEAAGIPLALENMEPQPLALVTTWPDLADIFAVVRSPLLGIALDVAHLYNLTFEDADELIERAEPLMNVHLSDASKTKAHLLLGDGDHEYGRYMKRLAQRYSGPVVVEGFMPGLGLAALDRIMASWRALGM